MNKTKPFFLALTAFVTLSTLGGCASLYTNIEKTGDNTYLVTRVKQGFFNAYGTLFQCTAPREDELQCHEVGAP